MNIVHAGIDLVGSVQEEAGNSEVPPAKRAAVEFGLQKEGITFHASNLTNSLFPVHYSYY